jgi:uncharacterized repeat protein (TIGR03803 family)
MSRMNPAPSRLQPALKSFCLISSLCVALAAALPAQTVSNLYVFTDSTIGSHPSSALVQGRDGKLYGVTNEGGANSCSGGYGCGTIYKLDLLGNLTTLHNFDNADGFVPGGLTLGSDGNLYGPANQGGAYGFGTLFRITPNGVFTKLHDFANTGDGEYPQGPLLQASNGNFYGLTENGLFRMTLHGAVTALYNFSPYPLNGNSAALIQAADGDLRATISTGFYNGDKFTCGAILRFNLQGSLISSVDFGCGTDQPGGNTPVSTIQALDGNFYGTTIGGGTYGDGTAFEIGEKGGVTVLHDYSSASFYADAGLIQGTDGNFYGVVEYSTVNYSGTIDQITAAGTYTEVGDLPNDGENFPDWPLIQHTNGSFYGVTYPFDESYYDNYGSIYSFDNGLGPFITFVGAQGEVGSTVQILGQGFEGTSSVEFDGVPATSFSVLSNTYMTAVVPEGAISGLVTVTTPKRLLTSNKNFTVIQ